MDLFRAARDERHHHGLLREVVFTSGGRTASSSSKVLFGMLEDKNGNVVGTDSQEYDTLGLGEQIGGDAKASAFFCEPGCILADSQSKCSSAGKKRRSRMPCSEHGRWSIGGFDWTCSQQLHQVRSSGELCHQ